MHYLDNAATSWPKPEPVYHTLDLAFREGMSAGRGTSKGSRHGPALMQEARATLAGLIHAPEPERIAFTGGCTQALNAAIQAFPWQAGDGVVISALEHNAMSRPLRKMVREKAIELHVVPYTDDEPFDLVHYQHLLRTQPGIRMVATMHASNVVGSVLPVEHIGRLAKQYGKLYLLDAAQSIGFLPIDVQRLGVDMLAMPAHKSLYGPPGIGALYVAEGVPLETFIEGGTGADSGKHRMGTEMPHVIEVGTIPLPQILAMSAGASWVKGQGLDAIRAHELSLLRHLLDGLAVIPGLRIYGHTDVSRKTPVVSFNLAGHDPKALGNRLADDYDIALRAGFHCSPMAHEALGTLDGGGTVRASIGFHTREEDIDALLAALARISQESGAVARAAQR